MATLQPEFESNKIKNYYFKFNAVVYDADDSKIPLLNFCSSYCSGEKTHLGDPEPF